MRRGSATEGTPAREGAGVPSVAWGPVLTVTGALGLVLLLFSGRYGFFGDELYFIAAGRELDWGYADQPPLLPLLALLMDNLFPGSVAGLRLPATLITTAGAVVAALMARELGGGRGAQVASAGAYALSGLMLGRLLATSTVDPVMWGVVLLLIIRWVRTRDDKLLVWSGLATAVAMQTKFLIPTLWVVLGVSVLVMGPRDLLRRPMLWVGALLAVLITVPTLLWQAANGWPQLEMRAVVAGETELFGGPWLFLPMAVMTAGIGVGTVFVLYGLWRLFRSPELRDYRFLGLTVVGVFAVFGLTGGRIYYASGLFPVLFAVAAVEFQRRRTGRWLPWVAWPAFALSALLAAGSLPLKAESELDYPNLGVKFQNFTDSGQFGWTELTDAVAGAYRALPPEKQRETALVSSSYWLASALAYYGPDRGLPASFSPHRGFYYFGAPAENVKNIVYSGGDPGALRSHFASCTRSGTSSSRLGITDGTSIWTCEGFTGRWAEVWPGQRKMG
ncbi:glycosyltransferase family 39 protein [Allokutzneria sp. A3M-2-11 16]|uniref:ArnT family glycosyltransferase n=1 Tax=Allokutzneria sp. A3M-2-11 16 TaxID=2962043 RepID=UPI0020B776A0|nr:glycosyltransferase family 39 protein [Allokutzneria sp. A3M-2-11 16]MCP3798491.1 glycosyltransferase family 39 protein [Allokutzneria sp. A3M-2-11 16]